MISTIRYLCGSKPYNKSIRSRNNYLVVNDTNIKTNEDGEESMSELIDPLPFDIIKTRRSNGTVGTSNSSSFCLGIDTCTSCGSKIDQAIDAVVRTSSTRSLSSYLSSSKSQCPTCGCQTTPTTIQQTQVAESATSTRTCYCSSPRVISTRKQVAIRQRSNSERTMKLLNHMQQHDEIQQIIQGLNLKTA